MLANPVVPSLKQHMSMLQMLEKSHIVKHWMKVHQDLNEFRFSVLKRYKDCLSRQLGEALTKFTSSDHLLNSKNENILNNITRMVVQEEIMDRKVREMR